VKAGRARQAAVPPEQVAPSSTPERDACEASLRARFNGQPAASGDAATRLMHLQRLFGLSPFETDVVAALWTTSYSPSWRAELAARDPFAGHLTVLGLSRAFGHPPAVRLASESPLRVWRLAAEHPFVEGTAALSLDPNIAHWLDGRSDLDHALVGHVRLIDAAVTVAAWQLDRRAQHVADRLRAGDRCRIRLIGQDFIGSEACAAGLAHRLGLLVFAIDIDAVPRDDAREHAVRAQRQAYLDASAPCWHARNADVAWPREVPPFPVQFVIDGDALPVDERFHDFDIVVSDPSASERRALWLAAVPSGASWPAEELDDLAFGCEASSGEILRVAATDPRDAPEAARRVRETAIDDLGGLAQRLACTFTWDDLVVPPSVRERLEEVTFEARERARLWSEPEALRLYPQGRGLVVLLAGPPGTGKTMSAQVIAAALGLDLLRVDVSRVLSKWVGETAQHLQKVLSSPGSRRAVLLFDEADALFGRRIEEARQAQDHFINMDLSQLMVALESYTGVVLLATNLKANLDHAFVRRIRHAIDFQLPDAAARQAIWRRAARALFGRPDGAEVDDAIARVARLEASGAQIKNAALSAAFASRRERRSPDAALFGRMLARELAKDGAGLSARELTSTLEAPL
jgi:adenylate kinase family enzyme